MWGVSVAHSSWENILISQTGPCKKQEAKKEKKDAFS